jgi:hypothetical protein
MLRPVMTCELRIAKTDAKNNMHRQAHEIQQVLVMRRGAAARYSELI